jgi:hypothetical protein
MKDLSKSFDVEQPIRVGETILPDSIFDKVRSSKPIFTGDLMTACEYFNSLTQVNANRIARSDFTYSNDFVVTQVNTYYENNGVTVNQTETITFSYSGDSIQKIEVV